MCKQQKDRGKRKVQRKKKVIQGDTKVFFSYEHESKTKHIAHRVAKITESCNTEL